MATNYLMIEDQRVSGKTHFILLLNSLVHLGTYGRYIRGNKRQSKKRC
jgi:hypothetical protein